jgi:hypothetical protein
MFKIPEVCYVPDLLPDVVWFLAFIGGFFPCSVIIPAWFFRVAVGGERSKALYFVPCSFQSIS